MQRFRWGTAFALLLVLAITGSTAGAAVASPLAASMNRADPFNDGPLLDPFEESDPFGGQGDTGSVESVGELDVKIVLQAGSADAIELRGLPLGSEDDSYQLARGVADALELERNEYEIVDPNLEELPPFLGGRALDEFPDLELQLDDRFAQQIGKGWTTTVNTGGLLRTLRLYEYGALRLTICPATQSADTRPSSVAPEAIAASKCLLWRQDVGNGPITISITEEANSEPYWNLARTFAIASAAIAVLGLTLIWLIRRTGRLRTLNKSSLIWIATLAVLSMVVWLIGVVVMATQEHALGELLLERDWAWPQGILAVALPSLLPALAVLLPACLLSLGKPDNRQHTGAETAVNRTPTFSRNPGSPGLPAWLSAEGVAKSAQSQTPAPPTWNRPAVEQQPAETSFGVNEAERTRFGDHPPSTASLQNTPQGKEPVKDHDNDWAPPA